MTADDDCCARATSGHAVAAPPRSVMNGVSIDQIAFASASEGWITGYRICEDQSGAKRNHLTTYWLLARAPPNIGEETCDAFSRTPVNSRSVLPGVG